MCHVILLLKILKRLSQSNQNKDKLSSILDTVLTLMKIVKRIHHNFKLWSKCYKGRKHVTERETNFNYESEGRCLSLTLCPALTVFTSFTPRARMDHCYIKSQYLYICCLLHHQDLSTWTSNIYVLQNTAKLSPVSEDSCYSLYSIITPSIISYLHSNIIYIHLPISYIRWDEFLYAND